MSRSRLLLLIVTLPLALSACLQTVASEEDPAPVISAATQDPGSDPETTQEGDTSLGGFVVDGGLTIPDAIAYRGDEIIAVQGFVYRRGEINALCELLLLSYPPECGGESLVIANPEATDDIVLTEAEGVQWSEDYVTVFGRLADGVLTIETTVKG